MYTLAREKKLAVLAALLEGNSVRSTERMTGVHRDTVCRLLVETGEHCAGVLDARVRDVRARYVQADEIWCFVGKKDRHRRPDDPPEVGDQWVFVAMDEETKLVASFVVGKRNQANTLALLSDLRERLRRGWKFQLTTDGFRYYEGGVQDTFDFNEVDYAQLIKVYGKAPDKPGNERYSPGEVIEVISRVLDGNPDPARICTSHVERQNLTMRMQMRRFTRLTNGFSKKLRNLKAAVALHFAWYNFVRVHSSLRITPAMAAGLTDHVWSMGELLGI